MLNLINEYNITHYNTPNKYRYNNKYLYNTSRQDKYFFCIDEKVKINITLQKKTENKINRLPKTPQ